jgi:aryl-alcohol dehydrogenase-like predicted oxidoreductase
MEQIAIGTSGLTTSRVGLGTWAIGGWMWGGTDDARSVATIRSAVERGVTLIDTAPVYGFGRSEEIAGQALAQGSLRDKVQIATKLGLAWSNGNIFRDSRPARIRKEVEDSMRRLRTDIIDLYQVHWPDLETPIAETAATLEDLRREGKIRAVGVSNYSAAQMDAFRAVAKLDVLGAVRASATPPRWKPWVTSAACRLDRRRRLERPLLPRSLPAGFAAYAAGQRR